tara:strand:- start:2052 stop:2858 length:807 start_codon:yes stop_codon:yes gene_type:complete
MKELLQIGIPCGRNSELFVEFLISSIERTASGNYDIEFIFGINQAGVDITFLDNIDTKHKKKFVILDNLTFGAGTGTGHGTCLNSIFDEMNSKYGMMLDCDTAFLCKGWDEKLISLLDEKTIIVGTEYGVDQNKFMNNPNCIMALFLVDKLKETGLCWKPENCHISITEDNCKIYGRSPGDEIFLDTSCKIPTSLHESEYSGIGLPLISPRIDKSKIKFMTEDMRGEEHHLDGVPVFSHLGRGLLRDFTSNPETILWKKRVNEWLKNL